MKTSPRISDSAAEEQASLWAARLEGGTLEASDRTELDAWLAEKPSHRALLSEYCQFSADLEQQLPVLIASGAVTMPAPAAPKRRSWSLGWLALTGGALAAAAVAVVVWNGQLLNMFNKTEVLHATSIAQRQSFMLDDGTRVELNAQSSLRWENSGDERRVVLASGEAFFMVAKDKSRPFIVETPSGSVRVTGTVFDVRTDKGSELDVTVVEGSVQVRPSDAAAGGAMQPPSPLTANMRLTANGKVLVRTLTEGTDDVLAWRQGQIVFDGVPLREALTKVANYHGKSISVSDEAAAGQTVGGRYTLDNFDQFLRDIQDTFPVRITKDVSGGSIRVTREEK